MYIGLWTFHARADDSIDTDDSVDTVEENLAAEFSQTIRPFVKAHCVACHGKEKAGAELVLSTYTSLTSVVDGYAYWKLVLERLDAGEMPPPDAESQPTNKEKETVVAWIRALQKHEAEKHAGDPGIVLARRLSNAEYDNTMHGLTGVDIRPTKEFQVDPANQAGFNNTGESLDEPTG